MKRDGQDNRISAILGDSKDLDVSEGLAIFYKHLKANLSLPVLAASSRNSKVKTMRGTRQPVIQ